MKLRIDSNYTLLFNRMSEPSAIDSGDILVRLSDQDASSRIVVKYVRESGVPPHPGSSP